MLMIFGYIIVGLAVAVFGVAVAIDVYDKMENRKEDNQ